LAERCSRKQEAGEQREEKYADAKEKRHGVLDY
jgi:hypothetical protein